ncbi:Thermolysin metallopeptidase, catalytic domain [Nocardia amikacinitolerans]|uniref:Neutral metalloproteinase n=1 Tax=Nocardia amikacinitolerans TaxID=756689 RepID=A0A285KQW8_9NOCA|nr:M4 family metallopeptidase [Nocardia amikacinitolerans]MCP2275451.1 Thermolysin metallopeptidase, catalytic domain [Nocardia amikacinitolerans]SNY74613.1 Thermolysin metallopeptidase, catalytic domain [Nocardia amikacinitolerans]
MITPAARRNCIIPPYVLDILLQSPNPEVRGAAIETLVSDTRMRTERRLTAAMPLAAPPTDAARTVFDCRSSRNLAAARQVRGESGAAVADESVNRAFDGLGTTRAFFAEVLQRKSIDDRGMQLHGYVHYGRRYNNALWDGSRMIFGDGDGQVFTDFTKSLDVIAHELAHGVTQFTADLVYESQSGALNESMSDVFGSLVKQWNAKQTADKADWLIGADIFTPAIGADALRSMKAPGTAWNEALFGKDPQPAHMDDYADLPISEDGDWGGVHTNSGIPNKAFYLAAVEIGGYAWEAPGHIWYEALRNAHSRTDFAEFAELTVAGAGRVCGAGSREQDAVRSAWAQVGVDVAGRRDARDGAAAKQIADLTAQIKSLADQVELISAERR